jgi:hypothetical protein
MATIDAKHNMLNNDKMLNDNTLPENVITMTLQIPKKIKDSFFTKNIEHACKTQIESYHKMVFNRNKRDALSSLHDNIIGTSNSNNSKKIVLNLVTVDDVSASHVIMILASSTRVFSKIEFKLLRDIACIKQCIAKMDLDFSCDASKPPAFVFI